MYYHRNRLIAVCAICFLGLLICIPNFMRKPDHSFLPWHQVHLGLDLQGGSYLLMQVDMQSLTHDRLQTLSEDIRTTLIHAHLGYMNITSDTQHARVAFMPRNRQEIQADIKALDKIPRAVRNEFDIAEQSNGSIALTISPQAMSLRAHDAVDRSIEIIRRRIDGTGAIDPAIARQGEDRIMIELPGISDPEHIKNLLGTTARLTFQLVDSNPLHTTVAPPGFTILKMSDPSNPETLPVADHVDVQGSDLTNAGATIDPQTGKWAVSFSFDTTGTHAFAAVTRAHVGHRFAIVLDNKIIEAPVIMSPITGGNGQITGNFDAQKATDLALLLRAGALPAPLHIIEERSIGPSLGADAIRAGTMSLFIGFVLVIAFMAVFYGRFGWYANFALLANLTLMLAILSLFEATLTLPGMAGMLLTLGMAVDANILICERIREERNLGLTPLNSMQTGFQRATATIIDSNVTALLAHVMLFVFGTGPVRGFALTITIGIATTLFTTLLLSRMLMIRWYAIKRPKTLPL